MSQKKILIVDDEAQIRDSLKLLLKQRGYETQAVEGGQEALALITANPCSNDSVKFVPELMLLDVMMPGIDGIELLRQLKALLPCLPVIMLTASKSVKAAVDAMKIGAIDYLNKPFDIDDLLKLIEETLARAEFEQSNQAVQAQLAPIEIQGDLGAIVGQHPLMQDIYTKIAQLAKCDTTVLITGESGTGKEMIAREIHRMSARQNGPFIPLNCSAIPETLIESELFGHEKGAFTHAVEKRIGYFEQANGGTLFLDEIGELSLQVQVKMLRFLQDQQFYRVGNSKPISLNVRVLAATNRSLETAIKEGRFRQDLFYRINVISLEIPPLRKRKEDIGQLINHFIEKLSSYYSAHKPSLSDEALEALKRYSWPGNVRELENLIESILALNDCSEIKLENLPARFRVPSSESELKADVLSGSMPFEEAERAFEKEIILKALEKNSHIQTRAAEMLGISRRILKYKMDKLGIKEERGTTE